jgi:hypothetical protein
MKRRIFLQRSGTAGIGLFVASVAATVGATLAGGCSSSNSGGSDNNEGDGVLFDVNSANGHSHSFRIPQSVLDSPPVDGFAGLTNNRSGHTHSVTLSQVELESIASSMAVAGDTTVDSVHSHGYIFLVT